jgi:hypothetical protein
MISSNSPAQPTQACRLRINRVEVASNPQSNGSVAALSQNQRDVRQGKAMPACSFLPASVEYPSGKASLKVFLRTVEHSEPLIIVMGAGRALLPNRLLGPRVPLGVGGPFDRHRICKGCWDEYSATTSCASSARGPFAAMFLLYGKERTKGE